MFIDYITVMLINLVAGLVLLAVYAYRGLDDPLQKRWAPAFAVTGIVGVATGLHMMFTWPIPGAYNIPFGEMEMLFGILFLGATLSLAFSWDLQPLTYYAFFAGLAAIVLGIGIWSRGMTQQPWLAGIGFILSGLGGMLTVPGWYLRNNRAIRLIGALILLLAALIWAITGYGAYWQHLDTFSGWVPLTVPTR